MNEEYVVNSKVFNMNIESDSGFGLSELEKNMSFTELLTKAQLNEIDYDEYGTDVDDDEILDARAKHREAATLEKELRDELDRLGEQLKGDNSRCDIESDYDDDSDLGSPVVSSDDDEFGYLTAPMSKLPERKTTRSNLDGSHGNDKTFFVGKIFENAVEFRKEIIDYCAKNGVDVKYTKNDKKRVGAKCKEENCEWNIWASVGKNKMQFQVKTYDGVHTCGRKNKVTKITYKWIARHYLKKFKSNPYTTLQEIIQCVWSDYGLKISLHMAFRAKKSAVSLIVGEYKEQYALLNNYAAEIMRSNANNTVKFQLDDNIFRRMYMCFAALREGFMAGCRPFISIDGCWLKGPYGGQLLVAVGRDENNQMFPIAWAIVDVENTESWSWFLTLLAEDLRTRDGAGYTIMSDQQKGLLKAVGDVWPQAEQRVCARHVYMNFREKFGGGLEYRLHFWKIAKSTTQNEFKENIDHMAKIYPEAAADLMSRNYEKWCRAFYTPQSQYDAVDNNMSEVFNAYILNSRHKPAITMVEDIRESVMERLHKKRNLFGSKNFGICPRIQEQLEKAKVAARGWNCFYGGNFTFGVREGATQVRYVVDLLNRTCSCNAWQLNGIPCHHVVAAIWHNKEKPESYVAECYKKATYLKAYDYLMEPLNGAKEWPNSSLPPIKAPVLKKVRACRPKKARRPGPGESSRTMKKSRVGTTCYCSICGQSGHNMRGCKLPEANQARSERQASGKRKVNPKSHRISSESRSANIPMHNRGIGMYTYPNGFQKYGNMSTRAGSSAEMELSVPQQSPINNSQPQQQLIVSGSSMVEIPTQVRQVAYYSDFEGEQTLRSISTMREPTPYNQSQVIRSTTNGMPSFTDSSGRKCVMRHTLQGWTNNRL